MAKFVGKVGDTLHYADARLGIFAYRGLHLTVKTYSRDEPFILITDLGRVKNDEEAVDKVAEIVRRERSLLALLKEDADG